MTIHKPTMIKILRSINTSDLDSETKRSVILRVLSEALIADSSLDAVKLLKGAGVSN
jgi:hypothetical protein